MTVGDKIKKIRTLDVYKRQIRTLMGLIRPTGGSASIFDLDCHSKASVIARDVG